jgi:ABC-type transport system substrate-binding protein
MKTARSMLLAIVAAAVMATAAVTAQAAGGKMIVTFKDDVSTLDPAIGYDWQNWSMIKSLFDGLMDYKPGTTDLVPELAQSYEISPDGTQYTFKLHPEAKFHNGRPITADDVKWSIERAVNPKTQSPGAGFFSAIKGFEEANSGKTDKLSGIVVLDPHTVRFDLSRPDATFLHVLQLNFSFPVPKEEVERLGADFGKSPVGSGAYKLKEWTLGQRIVFVRNPDYWKKDTPKLDEIEFQFGQDPSVALLRLKKGEVDILGDGIPPARFLEVKNDPANKGLIVQGNQLQTGYVTMNVKIKPFDNVKVRQAVNMAINKERIVKIINNRAVPANQPLPPSMPGYDKNYKGYPYDPEGAKKLLKDAGFPNGFETELYANNTDPNPRIAQAIQQDLATIGIKANLKTLAQSAVIQAGGDGTAPMIWSGGMAWIADFPDPSDFYGPILGCGGAVQGGWNWSWYCNKDLDKLGAEADAVTDPAKKAEREEMWRKIFIKIMDDAPWAPVFNELRFTMHSPRVKGDDSWFVDPVHIPVHYDEVYVAQ